MIHDLRVEHLSIDAGIERLREAAAQLDAMDNGHATTLLGQVGTLIQEVLLPHERADEERVYPLLARALDGEDPLAPLSRTHSELELQAREFGALQKHLAPEGPTNAERIEFQRLLYGLHAILRLQNAQEEELFHELSDA